MNAEVLVHVHCDSTSICICFNKISFFSRLFTKLDAAINRPVNNDVTYNNVLKWDELGEFSDRGR